MRMLRPIFLVVDIGFIFYWIATALHLFPEKFLYSDYSSPAVVAWNWSFMPLDLLVSATGLLSIYWWRRSDARYRALAQISLALTSASGLQAISYWTIRGEFDVLWWLPNLFLLTYPWLFICKFLKMERQG